MKISHIILSVVAGMGTLDGTHLLAFDFGNVIGVGKAIKGDHDDDGDLGKLKNTGGISLKKELEIGGSLAAEIAGNNGGNRALANAEMRSPGYFTNFGDHTRPRVYPSAPRRWIRRLRNQHSVAAQSCKIAARRLHQPARRVRSPERRGRYSS